MLARKQFLGNYQVLKTIGQGAFSKVKLGIHKETGQKVAIKIIDKKEMSIKAEKAKKAAAEKERKKKEAEVLQLRQQQERARRATGIVAPDPAEGREEKSGVVDPRGELDDPGGGEKGSGEGRRRRPTQVSTGEAAHGEGKEVKKEEGTLKSFMSTLQLEVQLLMRLDHPNVINLYQVMETEDECFVVMEYAAGGELIDYIAARDYLSEREARRLFRQIISAMDHCHMANVVHRDLKLENLLLTEQKNILISDFGLGRTFLNDRDDYMKTFCGTPNYAAVELITGTPYIGVKADIWAMGVVLYVMMTGRPPFSGDNISALYSKIKNVDYKCPDYFSKELRSLLSKILRRDPKTRIDMDGLRADPWVNFEEHSPPPRIYPKIIPGNLPLGTPLVSNADSPVSPTSSEALGAFVKSITRDSDFVVYTVRAFMRNGVNIEGASSEKNQTLQKNIAAMQQQQQQQQQQGAVTAGGGRRRSSISTARPAPMLATDTIGEDQVVEPVSPPPSRPVPVGGVTFPASPFGEGRKRRMSMQEGGRGVAGTPVFDFSPAPPVDGGDGQQRQRRNTITSLMFPGENGAGNAAGGAGMLSPFAKPSSHARFHSRHGGVPQGNEANVVVHSGPEYLSVDESRSGNVHFVGGSRSRTDVVSTGNLTNGSSVILEERGVDGGERDDGSCGEEDGRSFVGGDGGRRSPYARSFNETKEGEEEGEIRNVATFSERGRRARRSSASTAAGGDRNLSLLRRMSMVSPPPPSVQDRRASLESSGVATGGAGDNSGAEVVRSRRRSSEAGGGSGGGGYHQAMTGTSTSEFRERSGSEMSSHTQQHQQQQQRQQSIPVVEGSPAASSNTNNNTTTTDSEDSALDLVPSRKEIEEWHLLHKPPKEIRTVRYSFNPSLTSALTPSQVFQDVHRVLVLLQQHFGERLSFTRNDDYYLLRCRLEEVNGEEGGSRTEFEIE
ncbi:Map microtubule affinity-regulating kinase, partial [Phlyctochytrium planicorne]